MKYLDLAGSLVFLAVVALFSAGCGGSDSGADASATDGSEDVAVIEFDFEGTITGTWGGAGLSGTFSLTIDTNGVVSGVFNGDDAGTISGVVDDEGSLSASATGDAGVATWSGTFTSVNGAVSTGNGTWIAPSFGTSGTWTGSTP